MKSNKMAGLLIIIFGVLYLALQVLGQLDIVLFNLWDFWPLITITLGLMFEFLYFTNRRNYGFLVPGGILTTIGLLHLFETITNWYFAAYTWPIYVIAIFIAFFQVYLFTKEQWAWVLSVIFFIISSFLVMISFGTIIGRVGFDMAFSVVLILIGLVILLTSRKNKTK